MGELSGQSEQRVDQLSFHAENSTSQLESEKKRRKKGARVQRKRKRERERLRGWQAREGIHSSVDACRRREREKEKTILEANACAGWRDEMPLCSDCSRSRIAGGDAGGDGIETRRVLTMDGQSDGSS